HNLFVTSLRQPACPLYGAVRVPARCDAGAVQVSAILLTFLLTDASQFLLSASTSNAESWRRGSESNGVFTDYQPQYPDLQGHSSIDSKGLQAVFGTTRHLPDLTRHIPVAHSVIEEIVEGFVEGFFNGLEPFPATAQLVEITTTARL